MTMEIKDGRFVARIFFIPTVFGDVLAFVFRDDPTAGWEMIYRFRYYKDDKTGDDSADRKSWYHLRSAERDLSVALPRLRTGLELVFAATGRGQFEEVVIDSDRADVVGARLREQSWAHTRVEVNPP